MSLRARYTILRKIADGGTAEIFLATQNGVHGFEKVVVLKRIFPAYYADPQFRDMLVNEAHIAMSFNHSNIVQVLDLGEDDGQYILALELVDGWTLDAVIRRVRAARSVFPPALALYVTAQVCRALAYAHAKTDADGKPLGIVHRDISPHNVLLSEQGEVKLTDFGIATVREKNEGGEKVIRGKIAFMSPEQASGGPLDARSDLFSVGTMLYVMICGRYPFDAPTDLEVLLLVKNGEAVPPEVARPGIHPELADLLKRALAKNPADRFQSADDMLLELEQVMRTAFRAVGQTELKRWLQDLSARDGVPPVTKAPALPSSTPAGRVVGPGTSTGSSPNRIPPPPAVTRSGSTLRPPPPPAALSVGRRTGQHALPRGKQPAPPPPGATDDDAPILDAPTPLPETVSGPIALAGEPSHAHAHAQSPAVTEAHAPSPALAGAADPASAGDDGHAAPRSTAAALSARLSMGRPTAPVPLPPLPQGPIVPPPPVAPEILASVGGTDSKPTSSSAAPSSSEASARSGQRRIVVWAGAGLAALAIVIGSIKACGSHRQAEVTGDQAGAPPTVAEKAATKTDVPSGGAAAAGSMVADASAATPSGSGGAGQEVAGATGAGGGPAAAAVAETAGAGGAPAPTAIVEGPATDASSPATTDSRAPQEVKAPNAAGTNGPDGGTPEAGDAGDTSDAGPEQKTKVTVLVDSVPSGAHLTTAHHDYGTTPARIRFRAGNAYALTFKLDGFRPLTKHIEVTDDPDQEVTVTLRRSGSAPPPPPKDTPAAAPTPGPAPNPAPPPPRKGGKSWWQKMFSR